MAKDMDDLLAEFTDKLMAGTTNDELPWAPEGIDLRTYQEMVGDLHTYIDSQSRRVSEERVLSVIKEGWGESAHQKSPQWQSARKRRNSLAFAVAFAVIIAAVAIYPFLPTGDIALPGAAQGGYLLPAIMVIVGLTVFAYYFFGRSGNGKGK